MGERHLQWRLGRGRRLLLALALCFAAIPSQAARPGRAASGAVATPGDVVSGSASELQGQQQQRGRLLAEASLGDGATDAAGTSAGLAADMRQAAGRARGGTHRKLAQAEQPAAAPAAAPVDAAPAPAEAETAGAQPAPAPAAEAAPPAAAPPPQPVPLEPYVYTPLEAGARERVNKLITIFENASMEPRYDFAEELGDGRGITFGRAGFTTGTRDGLLVVRRYVELAGDANNTLEEYLPALYRIQQVKNESQEVPPDLVGPDGTPIQTFLELGVMEEMQFLDNNTLHDDDGDPSNDMMGLEGFAEAVRALGDDPLFRRVQDEAVEGLYYNTSQRFAAALGLRYPLSKAQLYDAWVQHGEASADDEAEKDTRVYRSSGNGMAEWVTLKLGGAPLDGVNETLWLETYLERRKWILQNADTAWAASTPRVEVYMWLLQAGALQLDKPIHLLWDRCTARPANDTAAPRPAGPCAVQLPDAYYIGGVDYGDYLVL